MTNDPFRHHPELRDLITPPEASFFRDLDLADLDRKMAEAGMAEGWRYPDATREALRNAALARHRDADLWVFGYGSLIWDPAILFTEVRVASAPGYARHFSLWDDGARGSIEAPGLMLALDRGTGCKGVAFRLDQASIEDETERLFRRELIADAYRPAFIQVRTDHGPISALTFLANHASDAIRPGLPMDEQIGMIARATGLLGSNVDYLESTARHLEVLGIDDPYVAALRSGVRAELARQ